MMILACQLVSARLSTYGRQGGRQSDQVKRKVLPLGPVPGVQAVNPQQ